MKSGGAHARKAPPRGSARPSPLVIGGVGGSGTRVFLRIAQGIGRSMGANLNESGDALSFYSFADRWLGAYHAHRTGVERLADPSQLLADLRRCVSDHRQFDSRDLPWGWKQPRSIHFLPLLHQEFAELHYLHVIRDGRDVAFGPGAEGELARTEVAILRHEAQIEAPVPVRLMKLWTRANTLAANYGASQMGAAYLRVRFEDLCRSPESVIARICEWEGSSPGAQAIAELANLVRSPNSIGRWRYARRSLVEAASRDARATLERFGYTERVSAPLPLRGWRQLRTRSS